MDDIKSQKDQPLPLDDNSFQNLSGKLLPAISLPNQDGNLLKLNRSDTFRLVIYFFSLTGNPKKQLPKNWGKIPGTSGCTLENSLFRDNYDHFIKLNALPIGVSTQTIDDIKEMTGRLKIQYDILSDSYLDCVKKLSLPVFSVEEKIYIKKITIIVEKNVILKVFYPIHSINKHVNEVLEWLKKN